MNEQAISSGTWIVDESKQAAFIDAWSDFVCWASTKPGATTLRLGHDRSDSRRFVSFGAWATLADAQAWSNDPEFKERLASVVQHCDDFHSEQTVVVAVAKAGKKVTLNSTSV
jgi:heme-degrading monooxygenase HmoA